MGNLRRKDLGLADPPAILGDVVELHLGWNVRQREWKDGRREIEADPLLQAPLCRGRPPDVQLRPRVEDRGEEPDALHVVEMKMTEAEVDLERAPADEVHAEVPDAGAGIEDDQRSVGEFGGHTGRVASELERSRTRGRKGATPAPDGDAHLSLLPEEDDHSDEVATALEEREGGRFEGVLRSVEADDPDGS